MALAACSKAEPADAGSEMVTAEFSVAVPEAAVKSVTDGAGKNVNRCIVEVQYVGAAATTRYKRLEVAVADGKADAKVDLIAGQTYNFLFFADCATFADGVYSDLHYDTQSGLEAVKVVADKAGNDDARDAFSACLKGETISREGLKKTVTLKRPLAQVNVLTIDLAKLKESDLADEMAPNTVKITYTAADTFNVLTAEPAGSKEFSFEKAVYDYDEARCTLAMDYMLAPAERKQISSVAMDVTLKNGAHVYGTYDNVPFERNYRTNIIGSLITATGDFSIVVDPVWSGSIDY